MLDEAEGPPLGAERYTDVEDASTTLLVKGTPEDGASVLLSPAPCLHDRGREVVALEEEDVDEEANAEPAAETNDEVAGAADDGAVGNKGGFNEGDG